MLVAAERISKGALLKIFTALLFPRPVGCAEIFLIVIVDATKRVRMQLFVKNSFNATFCEK